MDRMNTPDCPICHRTAYWCNGHCPAPTQEA